MFKKMADTVLDVLQNRPGLVMIMMFVAACILAWAIDLKMKDRFRPRI